VIEELNGLDELPHGWIRTQLGEVAEIILGQSPPSSTYNEDRKGLPFYQGKLEFGKLYPTPRKWCMAPKKIAEQGDVLISVRAPVGPTNICQEKSCIGRGLAAIRGLGGIGTFFILYVLRALESEIARKGTGTTFSAIGDDKLKTLEIPLPPLNEQVRIVARLEELFARLDAGVEGLWKVKAQLKRYRQAVLKYAFEGKLTEEWRKTHRDQIEPATKLLEQIKQERKRIEGNKYKELPPVDTSTLSLLPESWAWTRMGEIAKINPSPPEGGFPYDLDVSFLPMRAVEEKTGRFDLSVTRKYIEVKKGYTYFQNNDILFAKITPCMENGKIAIVDNLSSGVGFGSTEFHVIRPFLVNIPRKFIFYFLLQDGFRKDAQRNMTGSAGQLRVPSRYMENIPVPFPSISEQHAIIEEVERHFSVADKAERVANQSLKQAERLRQSVLKKAFEGKLVPQDPTDETATKLLERIREERARQMTKEGTNKIRRSKETPKEVGLMRYVK